MFKYIKKTYYEDDDFKVYLEEADSNLMVHVALYKFSPAILKRIYGLWTEIQERAFWQGYEEIYTYTKEFRMFKFFKGGSEVGEFTKDGETYKVWKWDLK